MFRIGQSYRDGRSPLNPDDEFLSQIRGPLESGIKNVGGIRPLSSTGSSEPAAIVLVSNDAGVSQHEDPWTDTINLTAGYIDYWGDAKPGKQYDESELNQTIKRAFDAAKRGDREDVPPILVFRKPEQGVVEFCGCCVPDYFEVPTDLHEGVEFPNYLFHLTVLNAEAVDPRWLHERARSGSDAHAPDAWTDWVETGTVRQWPTGEVVEPQAGRHRRYERDRIEVSEQFRRATLNRYDHKCALTGIEHSSLLDVAHVVARSDDPAYAEAPENVWVLNPLHHRAFDADLFTVDTDRRIQVSPAFDPAHPYLIETVVSRAGERVTLPDGATLREQFLHERNTTLEWVE